MTDSVIEYRMRLFVAGQEPNSRVAVKNITDIFQTLLKNRGQLVIIDVFEDFEAAIKENIVVTPALLVDQPIKTRLLGNLEDRERVLAVLGAV